MNYDTRVPDGHTKNRESRRSRERGRWLLKGLDRSAAMRFTLGNVNDCAYRIVLS